MRNHHRSEVLIHISGRLDIHVAHHFVHRSAVFGEERRLGGAQGLAGCGKCAERSSEP
jgi:hypothetical protein